MIRIATIRETPGLTPTRPMYLIEYTEDGIPKGRSYARADDLEEWKADLAAQGWTIQDTTEE